MSYTTSHLDTRAAFVALIASTFLACAAGAQDIDGAVAPPLQTMVATGDCHADGVIDVLDVLAASALAAGLQPVDGTDLAACSLTGSTRAVSIMDALAIAQISAGLQSAPAPRLALSSPTPGMVYTDAVAVWMQVAGVGTSSIDLRVEWSIDSGVNFRPATIASASYPIEVTGTQLRGVPVSPTGATLSGFVWDAAADVPIHHLATFGYCYLRVQAGRETAQLFGPFAIGPAHQE